MRINVKTTIVSLTLALAVLTVGCGNSNTSGGSAKGESKSKYGTLNVAYFPTSFKSSLSTVANVKGFYKEEGVDVNLVNLQNSSDTIVALEEEKIDVNPAGITNVLQAIEDGEPIKIIGGAAQAGGLIVTLPKNADKFKKLENWKGTTWATGRTMTGDFVVRHYLKEIGIDSNKDLESLDLGDDLSIIQAVAKGEAEVGYITANDTRTAIDYGLELIINVDDLEHAYPCCRISTTENAIKNKRDALVAYMRAVIRAYDFILSNREETIEIFKDLTHQDDAYVKEVMYGDFASAYIPDPAKAKVLNYGQYLKEATAIDSTDKIEGSIDTTIFKEALDQILEKYPDNNNYKDLLEAYNEFDQ